MMLHRLKNHWAGLMLLLMLWSTACSALVLERVTTFNQLSNLNDVIVIGEQLYYVGLSVEPPGIITEPPSLRVVGGDSPGSVVLSQELMRLNSQSIVEAGGQVYFLQTPFELWATGGTVDTTRRVVDIRSLIGNVGFISPLSSANAKVLLQTTNADGSMAIVTSDGSAVGTSVYSLPDGGSALALDQACVLDSGEILLPTSVGSDEFVQLRDGEVNQVQLPGDGRYSTLGAFPGRDVVFNQGDRCVMVVIDTTNSPEQITQLLVIQADASFEIISVPRQQGSNDLRIRRFNDGLLISRSRVISSQRSTLTGPIYALGGSTNALLDTGLTEDLEPNYRLLDFQTTGHWIYLLQNSLSQTSPPPPLELRRFNLSYLRDDTFSLTVLDTVTSSFDSNFNVFNLQDDDYLYSARSETLSLLRNTGETSIRTTGIAINRVIAATEQTNAAVFTLGSDRAINRNSFFRLQDKPSISPIIAGVWADPQIDAQGVQISVGLAGDRRTRFMLLTVLAHIDGEPVWLTGAAGLSDGQSSIELSMGVNSASDFLNPDASSAPREVLGRATLSVVACNQLDLNLELAPPYGQRQIRLNRVLDQSYANLCVDMPE